MKAIVRRYPINSEKPYQNEVYLEPTWLDWWDENGMPLCDGVGAYTYALCTDVPDDVNQSGVTAEDFEITPYEVDDPNAMPMEGEEVPKITRYTAHYIGDPTKGAEE